MKTLFKIVLGVGLAVTMASCGAANDPYYGNNGGYGNTRVYRAPDGSVYRQGEVYRDRNGNVYQNGQILRRGGDYGYGNYPNRRNLPPGQAKKVYGGSAKDYAPGQVKKRGGYYDYNNHDEYHGKKHKNKGKGHGRN